MTLENKLGIKTNSELTRAEEKISKKKALDLFELGLLNDLKSGTFETLSFIHKYLFEDIYDFADKIRNVNIAKGNFRFAPVMYLKVALENIEIKVLLKFALTKDVNSRDVYMKGIDASYHYEGYNEFKTEDC